MQQGGKKESKGGRGKEKDRCSTEEGLAGEKRKGGRAARSRERDRRGRMSSKLTIYQSCWFCGITLALTTPHTTTARLESATTQVLEAEGQEKRGKGSQSKNRDKRTAEITPQQKTSRRAQKTLPTRIQQTINT